MDIHNQFDQELLSAYLDGALTPSELAQVEGWLAVDQAAVEYVTGLRNNRNALKAMAAADSKPVKLNLAAKVLAQTHGVQPISSKSELTVPSVETRQIETRQRRWGWGILAASAAAILGVMLVLSPNKPKPNPLANVPGTEMKEPEAGLSDPTEPGNVESGNAESGNAELGNGVNPGTRLPGVDLVTPGRESAPKLHEPTNVMQLEMIFICDAVMSPNAWDSARFDHLLDKHGIRYGQHFVAERKSIVDLIENQEMAGADPDPNKKVEAALVYLYCSGNELNKIFLEVENEPENFLDFKYTAVLGGMSLNGKANYNSLLKGLRADAPTSIGQGLARLIVPEEDKNSLGGLLPVYQVTPRNIPTQEQKAGAAKLIGSDMAKPKLPAGNYEMLFILRKQ